MTAARARRPSVLDVARGLFLLAAVAFGWWALGSRAEEIGAALADVSPLRAAAACAVVGAGLAVTAVVWRGLLGCHGHRLPVRPAAAMFFVGQLGKYIPGSVWSLGAQADMARRYDVPARTTVAVGLEFLWVHVGTATMVGALLVEAPQDWGPVPSWLRALLALLGAATLAPPVVERVGQLLAGTRPRVNGPVALRILTAMVLVWVLYGLAVVLVVPPGSLAGAGGASAAFVGAFAVAYVVGVAVVLAPAGVGAREGVLDALLTPTLGLPAAAATALLVRAVHTVGDFAMAGLAWLWARSDRAVVTSS